MSHYRVRTISMHEKNGRIVSQSDKTYLTKHGTIEDAWNEANSVIDYFLGRESPMRFRSPWKGFDIVRYDNECTRNTHTALQVIEFDDNGVQKDVHTSI